ncbi:MAG: hypothetical protein AAF532_03700 [Planctomycetota bacterium]
MTALRLFTGEEPAAAGEELAAAGKGPASCGDAGLTLREYWKRHLEKAELDGTGRKLTASTKSLYRTAFAAWERETGNRPVGDIVWDDVSAFRDGLHLDRGRRAATVNMYGRCILAVLNDAERAGVIALTPRPRMARRPVSRLLPKDAPVRIRQPSADGWAALWEACGRVDYPVVHAPGRFDTNGGGYVVDPRAPETWRFLIAVLLSYGVRTGDLVALRWENVDPAARTLTYVPRKTRAARKVLELPIVDRLWPFFAAALARHDRFGREGRPAGPLFPGFNRPGHHAADGSSRKGYRTTWNATLAPASGRPEATFKTFRKWAATRLAVAHPKAAGYVLGHALDGEDFPRDEDFDDRVTDENYIDPREVMRVGLEGAGLPDCFRAE